MLGLRLRRTLLERCLIAAMDQATPTGAMVAERAAPMQPMDEVVVLLGEGVPAASMRQRCGMTLVPYLVIRCGSVPKVGTVSLLDLHYS